MRPAQQAPVTLDALSTALASVSAAATAPLGGLTLGPSRAAMYAPRASQDWAQAPQRRTSPLPGAVLNVSAPCCAFCVDVNTVTRNKLQLLLCRPA